MIKKPLILLFLSFCFVSAFAQTQKPPLHGKHWMAITGKPLGATAGAMIFNQGGNAVDASCAMLAAVCTMWDVLSWGGETQAIIYNPKTGKVIFPFVPVISKTSLSSPLSTQKHQLPLH